MLRLMTDSPHVLQGRRIGASELAEIRAVIAGPGSASRWRISRELCVRWNWRTETGILKDMAARSLLSKLKARGLIVLPPPHSRRPGVRRRAAAPEWDRAEISCALAALRPVTLEPVWGAEREVLQSMLEVWHPLGFRTRVGETVGHLLRDCGGRLLGGSLTGSSAWRCAARDRWIGWSDADRSAGLRLVVNQQRFLILDWVRVPHLASHALGLLSRRLPGDWQAGYGHPVHLLETFVEPRFAGTCYRAAGWTECGWTTGRTRNGRPGLSVPRKRVFARPLSRDWRAALGGAGE